jgi:colanic acid biosynthesis glycosyl transferase WcaI
MHIPLDKFVVLYAGTIGLVSGAEILVQVAKLLQPYPDILLIMVGEGFARDKVELQAKQAGLTNVRFFPFQPRPRLSEVQATADISLVTLAPGRGRTSVPSKVLGYMAAARPVIASVDDNCDTADLIRSANCGLVTPPADAGALAQAILRLVHNPELRQQMGQSGQRYFAANLERKQVLTNYISLVERMMDAG